MEADGQKEIEVGDGTLVEGSTFENPPYGGTRDWTIVFSCAVIYALLSTMELLIWFSIFNNEMSSATGVDTETQEEIYSQYITLVNLYAPLGAVAMIFLGYQATVCIGAVVVMVALVILSFLKDDTENAIKFLMYGPAAIGTSFIKLGALIPVLEYFTAKRMKALFLSRLGIHVGQISGLIIVVIIASLSFPNKWRNILRGCAGICVGISLTGLTLKELKHTFKDGKGTFIEKALELKNRDIFKNVLFWSTCVAYFFYEWGIETPKGQLTDPDMLIVIDVEEESINGTRIFTSWSSIGKFLLYNISPTIGQILGMLIAWIYAACRKDTFEDESRLHRRTIKDRFRDRFNIALGILAISAFLMATGCFIAPMAVNWSYFFPFSVLFNALYAFCEGLRDDAVPEEFGRDNIRIVEGLILMFAGLGGVITNEIAGEMEGDGDDDWKKLFNYGGGMLMASTVVTFIVLLLKQCKLLQSKFTENSVAPIPENEDVANQPDIMQQTHHPSVPKPNQSGSTKHLPQSPESKPNQTGST